MADGPDVPGLLREAAAGYAPDRERMRARVERGVREARGAAAPGARRRASARFRVAGAAAALVVTLGGAAALASVVGGGPGQPGPAAEAEPSAPAGTAVPSGTPAGGGASGLSASGEVDPGSNEYWSQSNVTVRTEGPLTSLTVELRIAAEAGMRSTGAWRTLPAEDFDHSVGFEAGGVLVFRWELREGAEVPAGEHVFAGQYDHDRGAREAGGDRYSVRGTGPAGDLSADGGFH